VKILDEIVVQMVADLTGSISAEHGIGSFKVLELEEFRSDVELDIMRAIRKALDPRHTMNPGKVIRLSTDEAPVLQRTSIR
jgi:FAD/FMN-containing dehydrogenase